MFGRVLRMLHDTPAQRGLEFAVTGAHFRGSSLLFQSLKRTPLCEPAECAANRPQGPGTTLKSLKKFREPRTLAEDKTQRVDYIGMGGLLLSDVYTPNTVYHHHHLLNDTMQSRNRCFRGECMKGSGY